MAEIPALDRFFRLITQRSLAHLQHRVVANLSLTAEQRYDRFAESYPKLLNRMPGKLVASYLGFTPEFLSRLRNRKAHTG